MANKKLTTKGAMLYLSIDPANTRANRFFDKVNRALVGDIDAKILTDISANFAERFNKIVPNTIKKALYTRTGKFSSPGNVTMYTARVGRRQNSTVLRVRTDSPQALSQELGREPKQGRASITSNGRSWKITGGKLTYVPLFSYFGRKGYVEGEEIDNGQKFFIGRKVYQKGGKTYLIAYEAKDKRSLPKGKRGPQGKRARRSSSLMKEMFKAMFLIYVGGHPGIGYSSGIRAKGGASPSRWFSLAVEDTIKDIGNRLVRRQTLDDIEAKLAQALGLTQKQADTFFGFE